MVPATQFGDIPGAELTIWSSTMTAMPLSPLLCRCPSWKLALGRSKGYKIKKRHATWQNENILGEPHPISTRNAKSSMTLITV
jgi:hypothetical protein